MAENDDLLEEMSNTPKRFKTDKMEVEQHAIGDMIEYDRYKKGASGSSKPTFKKISVPGQLP